MKRFAISMKTDWIFDGIEAWINEGKGRMAKIWGESIVAHFARKVRATDMWRSLGHDLVIFFRVLGRHEHVAMSGAIAL